MMARRFNIRLAANVSLAACAVALAQPAVAQDGVQTAETEASADEIIVTARGFRERLQDVPITVSTLSSEDFRRQGIDDLTDVAEKTVGFAFENFTGPLAQPTIRGQTNLRTTSPVLNVASYIDGIYLQRAYLIDQSLLELDRVEIIKGPQSSLYGRNAFAGVINLVSRRPNLDRLTGNVSGTIGTNDRYDIRGTLSVPVIPGKLAILGTIAYSEFDGTWRNNHPLANAKGENAFTSGRLGGYQKESYQVRAVGEFGDFTLDALYIHTKRELEQPASYQIGTTGATNAANTLNCSLRTISGTTQNRLYCGELTTNVALAPGETRLPGILIDPRSYGQRGPTDVVSGKIEFSPEGSFSAWYQFGHTKAAITTRGSSARDPLLNFAAFGGTFFDSSGTDSSFKSYSHEARVTYVREGVRLFAGVNYSRTSDIESNASEVAPANTLTLPNRAVNLFPIGPGLPFPANPLQRRTFFERIEDIWSVYGFAEASLAENLIATLEGRYTIEDQEGIDRLTREPANQTIQALSPPIIKRVETYFTPRVSVTYKLTPNNNIYAAVARGVKSGGLNGVNTVLFVPQRRYAKESNWTYEIGSKNSFPDIGLTVNLSAYYTDWTNLQTTAAALDANGLPRAPTFSVSTVTGNVGDVTVKGVEIEGSWRVVQPILINFGASYNRSRYNKDVVSQRIGITQSCDGTVCAAVPPGGSLPIGGNQLERVPEFDALLGVTYETTFANDWEFFIRGDVTYQTKQYVDEANVAFVPDRTLVNAAAGLTIDKFGVNFWVKNLFDKKYVTSSLFLVGTAGLGSASYVPIFGEQRTMGLTGTFSF